MSYLFVDSTYELVLGVLSEELKWLSFEKVTGQKASAVIQVKSYELLRKHNLTSDQLSGVITVNGPGFYTGLRLAEGFADVLKFFGKKNYSFYSYEIPLWCGFQEGCWFTKAYRGEYYFYHWQSNESSQELRSSKDLETAHWGKQQFIHSDISLDEKSCAYLRNPVHTTDLLQEFPEKIFTEVLKGGLREPFYFRAPEDEFKVNP